LGAGARGRQRQGGPLIVEHPAAPASPRIGRVKIQVDRATEINPANQRQAILVGECRNLDRLAVESL
jgi:hypothetical protein